MRRKGIKNRQKIGDAKENVIENRIAGGIAIFGGGEGELPSGEYPEGE